MTTVTVLLHNMKKAPEKQELFLFSILILLVSLCHLSLIHSGQCILQNLRKVHMIGLRKCIQPSRNCQIFSNRFIPIPLRIGVHVEHQYIYKPIRAVWMNSSPVACCRHCAAFFHFIQYPAGGSIGCHSYRIFQGIPFTDAAGKIRNNHRISAWLIFARIEASRIK